MKQILMANDLSARSDRALRRAVLLAGTFGAKVEVLTVIEEMFLEAKTHHNLSFASQALAAQIAAVPEVHDARISQRVIVGLDYEDIIRRSEEIEADLVVLGIHRHKARELFQGTTAERVVRYGGRPVLVVKDTAAGPYRRAMVASDLSHHAEAAVRTAARLVPKGEVYLVHAVQPPFVAFLARDDQAESLAESRRQATEALQDVIARLASELGDQAPHFEIVLPEGDVMGAIQTEIERLAPDLLAVGTHGRSGMARAVIGSIAEQFLADCPVDVLACKPHP